MSMPKPTWAEHLLRKWGDAAHAASYSAGTTWCESAIVYRKCQTDLVLAWHGELKRLKELGITYNADDPWCDVKHITGFGPFTETPTHQDHLDELLKRPSSTSNPDGQPEG